MTQTAQSVCLYPATAFRKLSKHHALIKLLKYLLSSHGVSVANVSASHESHLFIWYFDSDLCGNRAI